MILCALLIAAVFPAQASAAEPLKIEVTGVPVNLNVGATVPTTQTIKVTVNGAPYQPDFIVMNPITNGSQITSHLDGGSKITTAGDYIINIGLEGLPKKTGISSVTVNGTAAAQHRDEGQIIEISRNEYVIYNEVYVDNAKREIDALKKNGRIYNDTILDYDGSLQVKIFIKVGNDNFPFTDVSDSDWFYGFVKPAYESGIVGGTTPTTYSPKGQLTHAQIMVMVANLHSKQKGDNFKGSSVAGDHWAASFRDYCKAEGIIDDRFDAVLDQPVTRAEMAYYFANTLTEESYKNKKDTALNDISEETYKAEIEKLAAADIVGGYSDGTFQPAKLVTRAEDSVFISNILDAMKE